MPFPPNLPGPGPFLPFHENPETVAAAAEEAIEVHASQPHYGEFQDYEWNEETYWTTASHESSLDAIPAIIAGPEPVELQSTQWDNEGFQFEAIEDGWHATVYGFPDQVLDAVPAATFPPDVTTDFLATALDPSAGQDNYRTEPQTEDYSNDSTIDTSWSMDFASGDETTIATQPLAEQPWFDSETEDYANDPSLDVTAAFFPPAAQDDSYIATLDLPDSADFTDADYFDQPLPEQLEGYLSPNDPFEVTLAAQPHYGELPIPEESTEDYANDTTLDVSPLTLPPDAFDLTIAIQPLAEQPWYPDIEIEEFAYDPTLDVTPALFQPDVTDDFQAALYPPAEQPWFPETETEDYAQANDDVTPQLFPPPAVDDGYIAAQDLPNQQDFAEPDWEYSPFLEQIEGYLSPNDAFDITIAAQYPLAEFPEFPEDLSQYDTPYIEQNEGYLLPPLFAPDEVMAAQPQTEPFWSWGDPELEDYQQFAEQIEGYLSPNDSTDTTTAATWFLPEHSEPEAEFVPDAAVDQSEGFLSITADDGYIATADALLQPFDEDPWFDFTTLEDGAVQAYLLGDDGVYAAQDLPDQVFEFTDPEQPEQPQTPLDVDWLQAVPIDNTVIAATQPLAEQWWFPEAETEDYLHANVEVVAQLFPPPPPSGTGPDVFTAILRPRWRVRASLRWTASSKQRWRVKGRTRWQAIAKGRFS